MLHTLTAQYPGHIPTIYSALGASILLSLGLFCAPTDASACDYINGPRGIASRTHNNDIPANGLIFVGHDEDELIFSSETTGSEVVYVRDASLTQAIVDAEPWNLRIGAWRPQDENPNIGEIYVSRNGSRFIAIGAADTEGPGAAILQDLEVTYITNALRDLTGAGCPALDTMSLTLELPDAAGEDELLVAAYFGETEDDVTALAAPQGIYQGTWSPGNTTLSMSFSLGSAVNHQRYGHHFGSEDPYCFSLAVMDRAGNIGERTAPTCLNTLDPQDPVVHKQRSDRAGVFGGCQTTGGGAPLAPAAAMMMLGLCAIGGRRRDR